MVPTWRWACRTNGSEDFRHRLRCTFAAEAPAVEPSARARQGRWASSTNEWFPRSPYFHPLFFLQLCDFSEATSASEQQHLKRILSETRTSKVLVRAALICREGAHSITMTGAYKNRVTLERDNQVHLRRHTLGMGDMHDGIAMITNDTLFDQHDTGNKLWVMGKSIEQAQRGNY